MKILAVGATGFIGSQAVRQLAEMGHEVAVIHRGEKPGDLPAGVERIYGDRDTLVELRPRFETFAADVVLDVYLFTERQAKELIEVCRGTAGRIVVLSSADVYRNYDGLRGESDAAPDPAPLSETAPLRSKIYPYRGHDMSFRYREEYDKILVERTVLGQENPPATVLRLPAVYGPGDRQHRVRDYLARMDSGASTLVLGEAEARWRWCRGYVGNVAAAIALAVGDECAAGKCYNVADEPTLSEREWVEAIGRAAGWEGEIHILPDGELPETDRKPYDWRYHLALDTGRIRTELGFGERFGIEAGLRATVEWERSCPPGPEST
jgi:nucleoside-diphosphate-sugar epimerase